MARRCATIPAGKTRGVHLLAADLHDQGIVLIEVAVDGKGNEIVTAPTLRSLVDGHGCVVTGDALFAQQRLSRQMRRKGGDDLWCVNENQATLHDEIAMLFATPPLPALPDDFLTATSLDTAHGRYEERRLTVSSLLVGYSDWPAARQIFRLERRTLMGDGTWQESVAYEITSLPRSVADAERLLALARGRAPSGQVGIENGLFYRRPTIWWSASCGGKGTRMQRRGDASMLPSRNMLSTYLPLPDFATALGLPIHALAITRALSVGLWGQWRV